MFSQLEAQCPHCPKTVAINLGAERLIGHAAPDGEPCVGSGMAPWLAEVPAARPACEQTTREPPKVGSPKVELPKEEPKTKAERKAERKARREREAKARARAKGGSVWTVSGGLPGHGKRR